MEQAHGELKVGLQSFSGSFIRTKLMLQTYRALRLVECEDKSY